MISTVRIEGSGDRHEKKERHAKARRGERGRGEDLGARVRRVEGNVPVPPTSTTAAISNETTEVQGRVQEEGGELLLAQQGGQVGVSGQLSAEYAAELRMGAAGFRRGASRGRRLTRGGRGRRGESQDSDTLTAGGRTGLEYPVLVVGQVSSQQWTGRLPGLDDGRRGRGR